MPLRLFFFKNFPAKAESRFEVIIVVNHLSGILDLIIAVHFFLS